MYKILIMATALAATLGGAAHARDAATDTLIDREFQEVRRSLPKHMEISVADGEADVIIVNAWRSNEMLIFLHHVGPIDAELLSTENMKTGMRPGITKRVCTTASTKAYVDAGYVFRYVFAERKSGEAVAVFDVRQC